MTTDRERVERALVPRLFRRVMASLIDRGAEGHDALMIALTAACNEPLEDLPVEKQLVIARRVERAQHDLLDRYEGRPTPIVLIALVTWVNEMTEAGRVYINPESAMWAAIQAMVGFLNDHPDVIESMGRSGERNGRWIGEGLRKLGYFL